MPDTYSVVKVLENTGELSSYKIGQIIYLSDYAIEENSSKIKIIKNSFRSHEDAEDYIKKHNLNPQGDDKNEMAD